MFPPRIDSLRSGETTRPAHPWSCDLSTAAPDTHRRLATLPADARTHGRRDDGTGALFLTIVGVKTWDEVTIPYPTQALLAMAAGMTVPMVAWMVYHHHTRITARPSPIRNRPCFGGRPTDVPGRREREPAVSRGPGAASDPERTCQRAGLSRSAGQISRPLDTG
jgi:hypothetical protein